MHKIESHPCNILYLSYDGLTDPLGRSQILPYLIGLSKSGYTLTVISFEKRQAFLVSNEQITALCKENRIEWIPLRYHKQPPVLSTVYDIWILWRAVARFHKQKPVQIVHCRSYITSLIGLRFKRKWGTRFIFDMRGFWADERVEGGIWKLTNPLFRLVYQYFKKKEREFFAEADHIISLTENAKREIESWEIKTPITVIPTCVDLELFDPNKVPLEATQKLKIELGVKENDFVLLYLGSWGTWYLTNEMLNFFSAIRKQVNAKFIVVSPDNIDLRGFEFVEDIIIRYVKREEVPLYISLASSAVVFIKPSFSKKASSATKIAECMAMGVSIVTNAGWGDVEQLASKNLLILNDLSPLSMKEAAARTLQLSKPERTGMETHPLALSAGILNYQRVYEMILQ